MGIFGSQVRDTNYRLRFFVIITLGVLAAGSVLYWKQVAVTTAEYQDLPKTRYMLDIENQNEAKKHNLTNPLPKSSTSPEKMKR